MDVVGKSVISMRNPPRIAPMNALCGKRVSIDLSSLSSHPDALEKVVIPDMAQFKVYLSSLRL